MERTSCSIVFARRVVALVDGDHVGDLHDPGLERLDRVARARHEDEQDGVGDPDHLDLALPGADRLEEEQVLAGGVEHERGLQRRLGEPAEVAARPHRADEDLRVEEVVGEADAVAEERALGERARRVDGDRRRRSVPSPADEPDERAIRLDLPTPGGPGDADRVGAAGLRVELPDRARTASGSPFSTSVIARATARRSPSRTPSTSASSDQAPRHQPASARTRPSASAKAAFSSVVPTVTRIASGAPKAPSGRTITPSRSSASNSARASPPTSA